MISNNYTWATGHADLMNLGPQCDSGCVSPDPCLSGDCSAKEYFRVDDNQLGCFADLYISKHIVLTGEIGYTIFRRYRFGLKGKELHTYSNYKNDNFYFKAGLVYRLRFR